MRLTSASLKAPWKMLGCPRESAVLVALSGGADSVALLHLMARLAERDGFRLEAAHLNHGIRGEEAARDEAFCLELTKKMGIPCEIGHADVPALAQASGRSLETEAREARYAFLEAVMKQRGIGILLTAHHADDQLETVLFRMSRGTGLTGLCGIPSQRPLAAGMLCRPLLPFGKKEILAYCREAGLPFVTDSTNLQADSSRNRIRLEVVPALERVSGDPQGNVTRMTEALQWDRDLLDGLADRFYEENRTPVGLRAQALREAHPAIRRRAMARLFGDGAESVHLEAAQALLDRSHTGGSVALPGGRRAALQGNTLSVLPDFRGMPEGELMPFEEGVRSYCEGAMTVSVRKLENCRGAKKVHKLSTAPCLILSGVSAIMLEQMHWRTRREGDRILLGGKSLQVRRLCREAELPVELRRVLPMLCLGEEILWVPFVAASDLLFREESEGAAYLCRVDVFGRTDGGEAEEIK